jgi:hypothetical protein
VIKTPLYVADIYLRSISRALPGPDQQRGTSSGTGARARHISRSRSSRRNHFKLGDTWKNRTYLRSGRAPTYTQALKAQTAKVAPDCPSGYKFPMNHLTSDERKALALIVAGILVAVFVSHLLGIIAVTIGFLWLVFGD